MRKKIPNKKTRGNKGEKIAAEYLEKQGFVIVCRNYRCLLGEIDLVAREGNYLVFVEVRTRYSKRFGSPAESITFQKEKRLRNLASYYIKNEVGRELPCRFDLVGIENQGGSVKIEHIKGLFA